MKRWFEKLLLHYKGNIFPMLMNVIGMTIAFIAAIVILLQVYYDVTYDTFHKNADRLYQLQMVKPSWDNKDSVSRTLELAVPFVKELLKEDKTPEIKTASFSHWRTQYKTWHGIKHDFAQPFRIVDGAFIKMFSFEPVSGDFNDFNNSEPVVLIPESIALKQWGSTDIVGKEVLSGKSNVKIGAVYKDFPSNSMVKNDFYMPMNGVKKDEKNWGNWEYTIFIELSEFASYEDLKTILDNRLDEIKERYKSESPLSMNSWEVELVPIHDLHYITVLTDVNYFKISKDDIKLLFIISLIIILIAGFNFTNFSIALIPQRIKNVNLHRILGAGRKRLIAGVLGESVLLVLISWILAVLSLIVFVDEWLFSTSTVRLNEMEIFPVIGYTLLMAVVLGVLIGLYPAIYLTRESPQIALKRHFGLSRTGKFMQNVLLTLQLFCSITLITISYTMLLQERYLLSGGTFNKDQLLFAYMKDTIPDSKPLYEQMSAIDGVEGVALSLKILTTQDEYTSWGWNGVITTMLPVSRNYPDVMGIDMVEGRTFNETDSIAVIFNETAHKMYSDKIALGKRFGAGNGFDGFEIIGICKDVNFKSLRSEIEPMGFFVVEDENLTCVNVKISNVCDVNEVKKSLTEILDRIDGNYQHTFRNLDEIYTSTYRYENLTTNRITLLALVAIIISVMGLYGMIIMNGEYSLKEIATKKVLGAGVCLLIGEQLRRYMFMLMIAVCGCVPLYYYFINEIWLSRFYYHVEASWWLCMLPVILTILFVLVLAVVFMLRYMYKNPSEILKYE